MKNKTKIFISWIAIYLLIAIAMIIFITKRNSYYSSPNIHSKTNEFINSKIVFKNLLDRNETVIDLQLNADITILDFWYRGCSPCLKEMSKFDELISDKENKVEIMSISIDGAETWLNTFKKSSSIKFLRQDTKNWKHYNLIDSSLVYADNSLIAKGSGLNLTRELGIVSFPSYLVLDKNGTLIALPKSGVDFIKKNILNKSDFYILWTSPRMQDSLLKMFTGLFIVYSSLFWTVILLLTSILKPKYKSKVLDTDALRNPARPHTSDRW